MDVIRSNIKVRVAAAFAAAALIGVGAGFTAGGNDGSSPQGGITALSHKAGHPTPPGCKKAHKYGKKPKKKCPKHNP